MKAGFQNKKSSRLTVVESSSQTVKHSRQLDSLLGVISNYSVLLVGDGIYDEYIYVKPQGKSPKENIITNKFQWTETFQGGVWAASKHVEGFCKQVDVMAGSSIIKSRYVEEGHIRKLFEVHKDQAKEPTTDLAFWNYDLVIVTDFGHGALSSDLIEKLIQGSNYLAVNAQTNSANYGFNLITKYRRADYVVLDELEARLAAHDKESPIEEIIEKLGFKKMVVTLGPHGAIGYDGEFHRSQGFRKPVLDTMGAGDAFFCVTAPFAKAGASMKDLLAIGNAAGAIKCGVVGHRMPVDRATLTAYLNP